MNNFVETLRWRNMLHDITPGLEDQLSKERTLAYIGFDVTAPSLHIGNLATIALLKHFQLAGHKPLAIVGGATTLVGDPGGKSEERKLMPEEEIRYNQGRIQEQLGRFLDFTPSPNAAELLNNYDWFKDMGFLRFLREVGKHIPVGYMTAKESVKRRLETGLSYAEFSYQLLQGYDFYHLYTTRGVKLQMGGADQWGNLTTGTELIRRKAGGEAFALTTPLLTKADGTKFGKTESGAVWLDAAMTSPYKFYQFWINCSDEDAPRLLKVFSLLEKEACEALLNAHQADPSQRLLQKALAKELTITVHSAADYEKASKASGILFGQEPAETLNGLDEGTLLEVFEGVPQINISKSSFQEAPDVLTLVSSICGENIFPSKGEARKLIQSGGLSINQVKITDPAEPPTLTLLHNRYLLVQKGKKSYYLIQVEA